jgi:hypothetical protein
LNNYIKHQGEEGRKRERMIIGCTNKKDLWKGQKEVKAVTKP